MYGYPFLIWSVRLILSTSCCAYWDIKQTSNVTSYFSLQPYRLDLQGKNYSALVSWEVIPKCYLPWSTCEQVALAVLPKTPSAGGRERFWTIEMIVDLSEDAKTEFLTIFVRNGPYNLFLSLPLKLLQSFWQNLHSRVLAGDMEERKGICIISSVACTMLELVLRYNVDG